MNTTLIRVSRKRSADPHEALILHSKRAKTAAPLVFALFKAAADRNDEELEGARVLDLPSVPEPMEEQAAAAPENPLGFVQDEAVGLVGEMEHQKGRGQNAAQQISLNGRLLQPVGSAQKGAVEEEEVVTDYYRIPADRQQDVSGWLSQGIDMNLVDVRFGNREDLIQNGGEEDEDSDAAADDDDDSNDEGNWRNDYPDEDSYDEDSDHNDPYGELVAENWHHGARFPEDNLHRRFQNIAINDRYEAYFVGDETDDDDEENE
ncbi:unnamed protein product [Caenorhabditis sp. 36 PRJEB53466]|nr:unnamed protein product [Caenorhabditis sp. 36 PRJEB53466]